MELHDVYAGIVGLAHDRPRKPACAEGFARARSTLEDEIFLALEKPLHGLQIFARNVHLLKESFVRETLDGFGRPVRFIFAGKFEDALVLLFGKGEKASVGVFDELRA